MSPEGKPTGRPIAAETVALAEQNRRLLDASGQHPMLSGIHTPMAEELTLEHLSVDGVLPRSLNGRYVRIGPNPIAPDPRGYHWFAGDGVVHGIAIESGQAIWYRNRWIRSTAVAAILGEPPAPGPRHGRVDSVNTNVFGLGGRTWAMVEAGSVPVSMSERFDEQRYDAFGGSLQGSFTAHPHCDPATGRLHAIAYQTGQLDRVRYIMISPEGAVLKDVPISGQRFPFRWNPEHKARVGLMPFDGSGSDVIWCDVEPCYVFHTGNAFENADGTVTLDVVAHDRMFEGGHQGPSGRTLGVERWTIDPHEKRVIRRSIDASGQEFPRYNEDLSGMPTRYLYTIAASGQDEPLASAVYKHDFMTGQRHAHDFGRNQVPGEFVFVPAEHGSSEDDGWLMGLVIDVERDTTDLVLLDARKIESPPVARVHLPHRIPPGFHGNWIPSA